MLVSVEELTAYMDGLSLSYDQTDNAEIVLAGLQSELEMYLNRLLEPAQVSEVIKADALGILITRYSPVWKIISLESLQAFQYQPSLNYIESFTPSPMERDPLLASNGMMIQTIKAAVDPPGVPVAGGIDVQNPGAVYAVEYVTGYIGPHIPAVKNGIKRVAARMMTTTTNDSLSFRQDQTSLAARQDDRPVGWTPDELKAYDRLRRRAVV